MLKGLTSSNKPGPVWISSIVDTIVKSSPGQAILYNYSVIVSTFGVFYRIGNTEQNKAIYCRESFFLLHQRSFFFRGHHPRMELVAMRQKLLTKKTAARRLVKNQAMAGHCLRKL